MVAPRALPSREVMRLLLSDAEDVLQVAKQELNIWNRECKLRLFLRCLYLQRTRVFPSILVLIVQGFYVTPEEMSAKEN